MDWYEEYIEEGVRDVVRLLRNNGFNTTWSCHHEMRVQITTYMDGEMKRLHGVLYNNGYGEYKINLCVYVENGHVIHEYFTVELPKTL